MVFGVLSVIWMAPYFVVDSKGQAPVRCCCFVIGRIGRRGPVLSGVRQRQNAGSRYDTRLDRPQRRRDSDVAYL